MDAFANLNEKQEQYLNEIFIINWLEIRRRNLTEEQKKIIENDRLEQEELEFLKNINKRKIKEIVEWSIYEEWENLDNWINDYN
jgi:hypothetical protein